MKEHDKTLLRLEAATYKTEGLFTEIWSTMEEMVKVLNALKAVAIRHRMSIEQWRENPEERIDLLVLVESIYHSFGENLDG